MDDSVKGRALPPAEAAKTEIKDDSTWKTGDFELISADNVRFKVDGFHLCSASSVFRDALGVGTGGERKISLIDPSYENAITVRAFLLLVVHGRITRDEALPGLKGLVTFLDKWGCDRPLVNLMALLELAVRRDEAQPISAFVVAACADQPQLCRLILLLQRESKWPNAKPGEERGLLHEYGTDSKSVWDPGHWPAWLFERGPPPNYLFALSRAYGARNRPNSSLAKEFSTLFKAIKYWRPFVTILPPQCPEKMWTRGDIEVVTADDVRFIIPSYFLMASSSVFRDKLTCAKAGSHKITLTEHEFETAAVVRLFLQLASKGTIPVERRLPDWDKLAMFLNKWKCEQPLGTMKSILENAVRRSAVDCVDGFTAAAIAGDEKTCRLILDLTAATSWTSAEGYSPLLGTADHIVWDAAHWPWTVWTNGIPWQYRFAVARAWGSGDKELSTQFKHYLEAVQAS